MPLDAEFRRHLHDLMVETSDELRDELEQQKRQLIWNAQQTHNLAALPIAYSEASIHAFRTRTERTIVRYLEALEICGPQVDELVEKEMLREIAHLTSVTPSMSLPPMVKGPQISAVRRAHAAESARVGNALYRMAANRLREAKMRASRNMSGMRPTKPGSHLGPTVTEPVVKTLAELKALPMADKVALLLKKLVHVYPADETSNSKSMECSSYLPLA